MAGQSETHTAKPARRRPRRYLVTGGLGYLGAWITSELAAAGHETFALSRGADKPELQPNPAPDTAKKADDKRVTALPYALVRADLAEQSPAEIAALLPERLDGVVHAASFNEASAPDYGRKALAANALGTRNLLEALVIQGEKGGRSLPLFLYFSTFHIYGESCGHITEDTPPRPRNDYGLTHLFGEEYCRMFGRANGLPHIVVRPSNGYGAPKTAASTKWYLLLNDLCKSAFTEGRIVLRSDPAIPRDFVWLGDVAAAVNALLERPDLAGRVFNISSGSALALGEVARRAAAGAARFFNRDIPLTLEQEPDSGTSNRALHVDNSAVCAALNMIFHDCMDEEILALLSLLTKARPFGSP